MEEVVDAHDFVLLGYDLHCVVPPPDQRPHLVAFPDPCSAARHAPSLPGPAGVPPSPKPSADAAHRRRRRTLRTCHTPPACLFSRSSKPCRELPRRRHITAGKPAARDCPPWTSMAARGHLRRVAALPFYKCATFTQLAIILSYLTFSPGIPPPSHFFTEQAATVPVSPPPAPRAATPDPRVSVPTLRRSTPPRTETVYRPRFTRSQPTLCAGRPRYSAHFSLPGDVPTVQRPALEAAFEALVARYLAPWIPLSDRAPRSPVFHRPVTMKLLNSMEVLLRGGAFRVRLAGDGTVRYRVLEHWGQTYRISRMTWTMDVLRKAMEVYPELAKVRCEFYVNVADSPRSTVDSMSRDMGGIPVFSFRTSTSYLDIPVPDPVEYGSNGNYVWKTEERVPFRERTPKLVFRGSSSSLQDYHDDNWLSVPRLRLAALSKQHPEVLDAGITKWMKLGKGATVDEIEESLATGVADHLDYEAQGKFQFILDVDGGLGSSRKRGILTSGSVPFFQKSNWYMWYEPLLKPFYHFLPVDSYLQDLLERVESARDDPGESERITERANCFGENVVSEEAATLYWRILLQRYSQLQYDPASGDDNVSPSMCALRPATAEGPMGCSDGWYIYNGSVPFGCKYKGAKDYPYQFECWRDVGNGTEFKFTSDPVHSSYHRAK